MNWNSWEGNEEKVKVIKKRKRGGKKERKMEEFRWAFNFFFLSFPILTSCHGLKSPKLIPLKKSSLRKKTRGRNFVRQELLIFFLKNHARKHLTDVDVCTSNFFSRTSLFSTFTVHPNKETQNRNKEESSKYFEKSFLIRRTEEGGREGGEVIGGCDTVKFRDSILKWKAFSEY